MTTTRTLTGAAGILDLRLPVGHAHVTVTPDTDRIQVTLSTPDDTGPAATAIADTGESLTAGRYTVRVPDIAADIISSGGHNRVVTNVGGMVFNSFHGGNVRVVRSAHVVNGVYIDGDSLAWGQSPQTVSASPINAEVVLPVGTALTVSGTSVVATVSGHLTAIQFGAVSGSVRADSVGELAIDTTSGSVEVQAVFGSMVVRTVSGSVNIGSYQGSDACIRTVSGNVHLSAGRDARGTLNASSVSGDMLLRGTAQLQVLASTTTGRQDIN